MKNQRAEQKNKNGEVNLGYRKHEHKWEADTHATCDIDKGGEKLKRTKIGEQNREHKTREECTQWKDQTCDLQTTDKREKEQSQRD